MVREYNICTLTIISTLLPPVAFLAFWRSFDDWTRLLILVPFVVHGSSPFDRARSKNFVVFVKGHKSQ
jgi:hypothetical protein